MFFDKTVPMRRTTLLSLALFTLSLSILGVGAAQAQINPTNCWQISSPATQAVTPCGSSSHLCIEWEEEAGGGSNTVVVASTCCPPDSLLSLACSGSCAMLDRPLSTGHVPSPELPAPGPELKSAAVHPRPALPVVFQGQTLVGDELDRLAGKTLHYFFMLGDESGPSTLYAFENRSQITDFIYGDESALQTKRVFLEEEAGLSLYADAKWQHANYFLPEGSGVDFKEGWWANKISSLRGTGKATWVTLFDGAQYSGSSLTLSTAWDRPSLAPFAWDDRARSVYLWPRAQNGGQGEGRAPQKTPF